MYQTPKWLLYRSCTVLQQKKKRGRIYFPENRSIPFVHLTVQHLTGRRIKICLVAKINGFTVSPDIIIIEFAAFDEHEAMASVKTI
jgi:hypothetical protein